MSDKITITIRAPNQKKDHPLVCEPHWNVERLKEFIFESYPGNPIISSQRLIYGGKYLIDNEVLSSVLKVTNYPQIVHLVLSVRETEGKTNDPIKTTTIPNTDDEQVASGVRRRRHNTQDAAETNQGWLQWSPEQMVAYYQQYGYTGHHNHEQYNAMLQNYQHNMQYYMQYYMPQEATPADQQIVNEINEPAQAVNQPDVNPPMNAQGGFVAGDDDIAHHDWLDVLFALLRYGFFLSIIYFYSTFWRFILVASLFLILYIYQSGLFQAQRRPRLPNEVERREDARENPPTDTDNNNNENNLDETEANEQEVEPPSIFATAWCFVRTFFSSLIPQPPPVI